MSKNSPHFTIHQELSWTTSNLNFKSDSTSFSSVGISVGFSIVVTIVDAVVVISVTVVACSVVEEVVGSVGGGVIGSTVLLSVTDTGSVDVVLTTDDVDGAAVEGFCVVLLGTNSSQVLPFHPGGHWHIQQTCNRYRLAFSRRYTAVNRFLNSIFAS